MAGGENCSSFCNLCLIIFLTVAVITLDLLLFIQGYLSSLSMKAFAYINLDAVVRGTDLRHFLYHQIIKILRLSFEGHDILGDVG